MKKGRGYFTITEILLWSISSVCILLSFFIFDRENYLTLIASLIGITSLIFNAKGNPIGQVLIIIFSVMYGIISYTFAYYGEMVTYLGMTAPMAVAALICWLKNPYHGKASEVKVSRLVRADAFWLTILTVAVTTAFYFILAAWNTSTLLPSTISVTTSFIAAYLTFRRSALFPLAYALNDLVLIVLWVLAAVEDIGYLSVVVCFIMFFISDIYGFINWTKMKKRQESEQNRD